MPTDNHQDSLTYTSTGYGSSRLTSKLYFVGNQAKFELFEANFLGYMELQGLPIYF